MMRIDDRASSGTAQNDTIDGLPAATEKKPEVGRGDDMEAGRSVLGRGDSSSLIERAEANRAVARFLGSQGFGSGETAADVDARTTQNVFSYLSARPAVYTAFYSALDASGQKSWPTPAQVVEGGANVFGEARLTAPMLAAVMAIGKQASASHIEEETFALARSFVAWFGPAAMSESGAEATGRAVVDTITTLEAAASSASLPDAHRALAERNIEALRRKVSHELAALVDSGNRDRAIAFCRGMAASGGRGVTEAGVVAGRTLIAIRPKDADADNLGRGLANEKSSFWEVLLSVLAEILTLGLARTQWGDGDQHGKETIDLASDPRFVKAFAEQTNDAGTSAADALHEAMKKGWASGADQRTLAEFDATLQRARQAAGAEKAQLENDEETPRTRGRTRPNGAVEIDAETKGPPPITADEAPRPTPRAMLRQATNAVALLDPGAITEHNAHHTGETVAQTIANLEWIIHDPASGAVDEKRAQQLLAAVRDKAAASVTEFSRHCNQDRAVMFLHGVATAQTSWTDAGRATREAGAITGAALLSAGPESSSAGDLVEALQGNERGFWNTFLDILVEIFTFSLATTAWGDGDASGTRTTELMHQEAFIAGLRSAKNESGVSAADVLREAFARGYRSRADDRVSAHLEEALRTRRDRDNADAARRVIGTATSREPSAGNGFPGAGFGLFDAARPPIPVADMATLFPDQFGSMSYQDRYAWERQVSDRLEVLLKASEPDEILDNLRTQYADASPAEQLMVARLVAQIMGDRNYDYAALDTDTPTDTTPQEMLEALQEAVRTGESVPEGICGDIHLATAAVLGAMGIDAGIGTVESHFVTTLRLNEGTFAIIDYGTLYLGRSMAEVFAAYEAKNGQLALWHMVTDRQGHYVGRVQTPVGRFLEQTLSPPQAFADFLQGKPLPEGVRVDMYNRRGEIEGTTDASAKIAGGLRARVAGGGATVHGTGLEFAVAGLGYDCEHFSVQANAGKFEAKFPCGEEEEYVGGDLRIEVRDRAGHLSYGASIGGSGTAQPEEGKGIATTEARVGAVYDVPLGSEDGSAYFGVQAIGLPSGWGPESGTAQGATLAGAEALSFHNREIELAAGVKLNLEAAQLHLGGRVTTSSLDRGQGVFLRYTSGRTQVDAGLDHYTPRAWQGRDGNEARLTVGRDLGHGFTLQAGGVMRLEGDELGELSLRKTGHVDWPFGASVPEEARTTIEAWGYDPGQVLQPRAGILRGLQYQALIGLQAGVRLSPEEYAALGIRVDLAEGTIVLPEWMHASGHLNLAASGAISLRSLCELDLGPVLAMDAELGGWNIGLLATWRRLRAAVAIGTKDRFVAGAQLGLGATGFASVFAGYQRFRPDGTKTTVTVGTDFNATIEQGEITFGGFNHGTSMGLSGAETWTYRNPGQNVANTVTGELFAHKRALSTSGFLDLFQFVSKTPAQKAKIAIIAARLAAASERGVGFFFSQDALAELKDDETLAKVARFVQSPGFERMITEAAGTWEGDVAADAVVFDSFSGGDNQFDPDKGDIHIGDIAFDEGVARPRVQNADVKVLDPGRRALARAWRKRGLRLLDLDRLSARQFRGLTSLLAYVDQHLDAGQMTNKQITFTAGGLRSLAESIGLLSGTKEIEAGATVALSPRILDHLADADLRPCAIELGAQLNDTERLLAGRLTRHLDSKGLLVNGRSVVRFHNGSDFPGDAGALFVRRGNAVLVNLAQVAGAKPEAIEKAFRDAVDDDDLLGALAHLRQERTQQQRTAAMARVAGRGEMAVYYPEAPPQTLADGSVRHCYRAYDVYGNPLKDAQGKPIERAFEITLHGDASRTDVRVSWDDGRQEVLTLSAPDDYLALESSYPELGPLLEGMIGDDGHLPGLRLLHLLQLTESERLRNR